MKQQKDNWVKILFSFAAPCKGKMALSDPEWHSDLVSGWSSGLPAAGCLPWNLYDPGAYFSLYHFGRNPA